MEEDVRIKPREGQHCLEFQRQLMFGTTPEEAVTFMAFALFNDLTCR